MKVCHRPRCNEPAVPHHGSCLRHAIEHADRMLAEAQYRRDFLRQYEGQLTLLETA